MGLPSDRRVFNSGRSLDGAKEKICQEPEKKKTDRAAARQNVAQGKRRQTIGEFFVCPFRKVELLVERFLAAGTAPLRLSWSM